jgi:hypothetical protein
MWFVSEPLVSFGSIEFLSKTHCVTVLKVIAFDCVDSFPSVLTGPEILYAYWDQKPIAY